MYVHTCTCVRLTLVLLGPRRRGLWAKIQPCACVSLRTGGSACIAHSMHACMRPPCEVLGWPSCLTVAAPVARDCPELQTCALEHTVDACAGALRSCRHWQAWTLRPQIYSSTACGPPKSYELCKLGGLMVDGVARQCNCRRFSTQWFHKFTLKY